MSVRLFESPEAARRASVHGVAKLAELVLQKDFAWALKDLRALVQFEPLTRGFISSEDLQETALENLRRKLVRLSERRAPRIPTRISRAAKERTLKEKSMHARKKKLRAKSMNNEG